MNSKMLIAIAIVALAAGLAIGGYMVSVFQKPQIIVKTQTQMLTVTKIRTVSKIVGFRPELIWKEVIADKQQLPPYTYVQVSTWMSHAPYTIIVFSPDSKMFAMGVTVYKNEKPFTEVRVYDVSTGKLLWSYSLGSGYLRALAWSKDGKILFVGEASVEGKIVALDVASKKLLWEYATSKDLGMGSPSEPRWYWPTVYSIAVDNGRVYFSACKTRKKPYGKICKLYCFEIETGEKVWVFPENGYVDTHVPKIALSPNGKYLAGITWYYKGEKWRGGTIFLLDASTGKLVASFYPGTRKPFRWCGSWAGLAWLDNYHVAFVLDDGRAYVLNVPLLKPVYEVNITNPLPALVVPSKTQQAEQGYVYAYSGYAMAVTAGDGSKLLLVRTSNTYGITALGKNAKPTIRHPDSNSIFFYLWDGKRLELLAKYPLRGRPNYEQWATYSPEKHLLAVPAAHDYVTRTIVYTGLYIYNLTSVDQVKAGLAEAGVVKPPKNSGVVIGGTISPSGDYAVLVTYPVNLGTEKNPVFEGFYALTVYRLVGG